MKPFLIRRCKNGFFLGPLGSSSDDESYVFQDGFDPAAMGSAIMQALTEPPPVNVAAELKAVQGDLDAGPVGP